MKFEPEKSITYILNLITPILQKHTLDPTTFSDLHTNVHAVERFKWSLDSLKVLVEDNLIKNNHVIGLILRNMLTDAYTFAYLYHYDNGKSEQEKLYALYYSDITNYSGFMQLLKNTKAISDDDYNRFIDLTENDASILKHVTTYCKDNGISPIIKTSKIVTWLLEDRKQNRNKNINNLYDLLNNSYRLWIRFSKHEHIGYYSYAFSRVKDVNGFKKQVLSDIQQVLILSIWTISAYIQKLQEPEAEKQLVEYSVEMVKQKAQD